MLNRQTYSTLNLNHGRLVCAMSPGLTRLALQNISGDQLVSWSPWQESFQAIKSVDTVLSAKMFGSWRASRGDGLT